MKIESIGIIGNLANVGSTMSKYFSKIGLNSKLVLDKRLIPAWKKLNPDVEIANCNYIEIIEGGSSIWNKYLTKISEIKYLNKFDLIISVGLGGFWSLPFIKKPYICYATGSDLREVGMGNKNYPFHKIKIAQYIFKKSRIVFYSPDLGHLEAIKKLNLKKTIPWRQFVDIDFWKSTQHSNVNEELHIFHPTNLIWIPQFKGQAIKGNDILFRGFKLFLDNGGKGKLFYLKRGQNILQTEDLIDSLGIEEFCVPYSENLDRIQLREAISKMDILVDQFHPGGGFGLISLESMSMSKPTIVGLFEDMASLAYPFPEQSPPIIRAFTSEDVAKKLEGLQDISSRKKIGKESRKWIEEYHDPIKLARWYLNIILKNIDE